MDTANFNKLITKAFGDAGLGGLLNKEKVDRFYRLTEILLEENAKYNLTAITDVEKIIVQHYLDSAMLAPKLPKGAKVADIGCGAGFPTLPCAILREDCSFTAIDSTEKRVRYVNMAAEMLGLSNVTAVAMRAEDGALMPLYREKYDVVTARAVAELRVLTELCMGYAKVGGKFIAMKGKNAEFELQGTKKAISVMGGRNATLEAVSFNHGGEEYSHPLIIIDKKEKTPAGYPRPYAKISKKPL